MAGGRVFKIRSVQAVPPGKPSTRMALTFARHVEEGFVGPPLEMALLDEQFLSADFPSGALRLNWHLLAKISAN